MQQTTTPSSLESPTMIHATGREATMAIIEELTLKACRLRSLADFALGETVSFDCTLRGAPKVPLTGRVSSVAENGVRRSYTITFDDLDGQQGDKIVMALDLARRFADAHRADHHTGTALTRSSPRIPVDLAVAFFCASGAVRGRATNLSTGGMLMNAPDANIPIGDSIELTFTLPGAAHETRVHGRVVAHQEQSPNYNIAFYNVAATVHAELERFVEANRQT